MSFKKIGVIAVVLFAVGILVVTMCIKDSSKDGVCKAVIVTIDDNEQYSFIKEKEVLQVLNNSGLNPVNKHIKNIKLDKIRGVIEKMPYTRRAECYLTKSGNLNIDITQRQPIFKVVNTESYFVDSERVMVECPIVFDAYLPLVSGRVTRTFAQNELFDFVAYIEKDKFLSNLIQQIYIDQYQEVELISIIGNQKIRVGKLAKTDNRYDFEKRLNRLKTFYLSGALDRLGWDKYSTIDLRFDKQIVCRKIVR